MTTDSTYAKQWQEYPRRRRWFRFVFLIAALFWLGGGQALFPGLFASAHSTETVGIAVVSAIGVSGFYLYLWRCPRCRQWFFRGWLGFTLLLDIARIAGCSNGRSARPPGARPRAPVNGLRFATTVAEPRFVESRR